MLLPARVEADGEGTVDLEPTPSTSSERRVAAARPKGPVLHNAA